MTYKDAMEWFKGRKPPVPGSREAFEMAAEALGCMEILEANGLMGALISKDAVMRICESHENDVPDGGLAHRIKHEVHMLPAVQMEGGTQNDN